MKPREEVEIRERLEKIFPNLKTTQYRLTSPEDANYNCVSWAIHNHQDESYPTDWWEPAPMSKYYWPIERNEDYSLQSYQAVFEALGYSICQPTHLNEGYTRISIFSHNGFFKHVCRQDIIKPNRWLSKIGQKVDIEHELEALSGSFYGYPTVFMEKPFV